MSRQMVMSKEIQFRIQETGEGRVTGLMYQKVRLEAKSGAGVGRYQTNQYNANVFLFREDGRLVT